MQFCDKRKTDALRPSVQEIITFLTLLFEQGLSYSSINSAKSAVLTVIATCTDAAELGSSILLQKFMRGVFASRPSLPRQCVTWDVSTVLNFLAKLSPPKALSLLMLSKKLVTLLALLSGHRGQSLYLLSRDDIECTERTLIIRFADLLKQTKPGTQAAEVVLPAYEVADLCVVSTFQEYVKRTQQLRTPSEKHLFISTLKPYGRASRDTIGNWIKKILKTSGINMSMFTAHSTRAASSSAALASNIPLATILKTAGWEQESTFRKFYNKPIMRNTEYGRGILQLATKKA